MNDSTFFIATEQKLKADTASYDEDKIPVGFIDETGFSHDNFSRSAVSALYNNGVGDFYVS